VLAHLTKILQKCQRDLAVITGTAAPGGGGGTNGDEVVEGEKLWSNLWSSTSVWAWHSSSVCDITVIYITL